MLLLASGCSRPPHLARGPFDVKETPTVIRFDETARSSGPIWEMCFEFAHQRDSRNAGEIRTVLLSTSGRRYTLADVHLDRRGEAMVSQVGRVVAVEPRVGGVSESDAILFEAVELSSDVPVGLRALRGGSRS